MSRSIVFTTACLALALAACGGSDKPTATPAPAAATGPDRNGCERAELPTAKEGQFKAPDAELDPDKTYVATVDTNCGRFEITLDAKRAPKTGASFKFLVDKKYYDRMIIHRIIPGFVFQGGDPVGNGSGGPGYKVVEAPPKKLVYEPGVVAMAKGAAEGPGTSGSQFFVASGPDAGKLPPDYALLGKVTGGDDVVQKIGAIITDPSTDRPDDPVLIKSIRIAER